MHDQRKNIDCKAEKTDWQDCDCLVKARVPRSEIQMLCKLVESMGHLGVVTTTDRLAGEVLIQTTRHCWPELKFLLQKANIKIEFLS
ncbi:MAG: DUF4911 domain-containing protein [Peptococcaceae bacterium]|nr:DUF4911 domain-containing protein [Peptococcaceae bacterium]